MWGRSVSIVSPRYVFASNMCLGNFFQRQVDSVPTRRGKVQHDRCDRCDRFGVSKVQCFDVG